MMSATRQPTLPALTDTDAAFSLVGPRSHNQSTRVKSARDRFNTLEQTPPRGSSTGSVEQRSHNLTGLGLGVQLPRAARSRSYEMLPVSSEGSEASASAAACRPWAVCRPVVPGSVSPGGGLAS